MLEIIISFAIPIICIVSTVIFLQNEYVKALHSKSRFLANILFGIIILFSAIGLGNTLLVLLVALQVVPLDVLNTWIGV